MRAVNDTSAQWWERVIVGVLFVAAIVYSRSAKSAVPEPAAVCPPKTLQALARVPPGGHRDGVRPGAGNAMLFAFVIARSRAEGPRKGQRRRSNLTRMR